MYIHLLCCCCLCSHQCLLFIPSADPSPPPPPPYLSAAALLVLLAAMVRSFSSPPSPIASSPNLPPPALPNSLPRYLCPPPSFRFHRLTSVHFKCVAHRLFPFLSFIIQFHSSFIDFSTFNCSTTSSTQQQQLSVVVEATEAETTAKMPYRTDLKRPDLKGQFPCNVCGKVFCHSSSLSRHRMQAHFKSYTCTQCNQEIASSDTLRSHMYRYHQIQRMFMCRCCNWAFPDKTSLHIHMQSMQKSGMPGDVSVLARSFIDKEDFGSPGHHRRQDNVSHPSFGSPSYNSSPDEEQNHRQEQSSSPSLSETEEKNDPFRKIDVGNEMDNAASQKANATVERSSGIFPRNSTNLHQYNTVHDHRGMHSTHPTNTGRVGEEQQKGSCIGDEVPSSCVENAVPVCPQMPSSVPSSAPFPGPSPHNALPVFQQQWFAQWLANNPFFATALDGYLNNGTAGGGIKGLLTHNQQSNVVATAHSPHNNSSSQMAMLQALVASSTANAPAPTSNGGAVKLAPQQHQPPSKKAKTSAGGKGGNATSAHSVGAAHQRRQQKGTKSCGGIGTPMDNDLSVHIPHNQFHSPFSSNGSTNSPASNDGSKMCALIDSLLHIKRSSGQNSPIDEMGNANGGGAIREETERRNKRKTRVPTRATEMAEIVYGDEPEAFFEKSERSELAQAASPNVFPSIQRLMLAHSSTENCGSSILVPSSSADPQQPSPAVSDSQTSGSSNGGVMSGTATMEPPRGLNSPSPQATDPAKRRHPPGESQDTPTPANNHNVEIYGGKPDGKAEAIRQLVDRITAAAEEVVEERVREKLIACARQLQLVAASEE